MGRHSALTICKWVDPCMCVPYILVKVQRATRWEPPLLILPLRVGGEGGGSKKKTVSFFANALKGSLELYTNPCATKTELMKYNLASGICRTIFFVDIQICSRLK